jgi:hypothetical protein
MSKRFKNGGMTRNGDPVLPEDTHRPQGAPAPREKKSQKAQYETHNPGPRNNRVAKFKKKIGRG